MKGGAPMLRAMTTTPINAHAAIGASGDYAPSPSTSTPHRARRGDGRLFASCDEGSDGAYDARSAYVVVTARRSAR